MIYLDVLTHAQCMRYTSRFWVQTHFYSRLEHHSVVWGLLGGLVEEFAYKNTMAASRH